MPYGEFTLDDVRRKLGYPMRPGTLFAAASPVRPPVWLTEQLAKNTPLVFLTEKSRSEAIVYPVLTAAREVTGDRLAVFSGPRLDVDQGKGLVGDCDFVLSLTDPVPPLRAPLVTVVEAKKADIELGLGQCAAEMVAARLFNEADGAPGLPVYGCVTSGEVWQFLKLEPQSVVQDSRRYNLTELDELLGVFVAIVAERDRVSPRSAP